MFTWLAANKSLTSLGHELCFKYGEESKVCASIVGLLKKPNWPSLIDLSFSGAYCDDTGIEDYEFAYGPCPSARNFFLKHPQLRSDSSRLLPATQSNFQSRQTNPLAGLPSGALPNLEYFVGIRNAAEDLGNAALISLKSYLGDDDLRAVRDVGTICQRIAEARTSLKKVILRGVYDEESIEGAINAFRGDPSVGILEFKHRQDLDWNDTYPE
ncbi:hypothetical protein BT69DRAFT_1336668 [Atractiella rhizophila]|nr:hypothetical protein BT69DRAFT_1336668 [Atractiella rhizophila]